MLTRLRPLRRRRTPYLTPRQRPLSSHPCLRVPPPHVGVVSSWHLHLIICECRSPASLCASASTRATPRACVKREHGHGHRVCISRNARKRLVLVLIAVIRNMGRGWFFCFSDAGLWTASPLDHGQQYGGLRKRGCNPTPTWGLYEDTSVSKQTNNIVVLRVKSNLIIRCVYLAKISLSTSFLHRSYPLPRQTALICDFSSSSR